MNVPKIRLKGFEGEWSNCSVKDVLQHEASSLAQNQLGEDKGEYPVYGASGLIQHIESYAQAQDYIGVVKDGAGVGRINLYPAYSSVLGTLHYLKASGTNDIHFLSNLLQTKDLTLFTTGSTIPHIYFKDYADMSICVPSEKEQQQIAAYFDNLDAMIEAAGKKIASLKQTKQACLQQMFPQPGETTPRIRFKGFEGEWKKSQFGEIFSYERPDDYIVKSDKYCDEYTTPVLTANKGFVLGYTNEQRTYNTPCIIFDDFTLDCKYVDFPFMVKSSALKILTVRDASMYNLYFSYYLLSSTKIEILGHARHYISVVQPTQVLIPSFTEQQQIAAFFSNMDKQIRIQEQRLEKLKQIKSACLDNMFV